MDGGDAVGLSTVYPTILNSECKRVAVSLRGDLMKQDWGLVLHLNHRLRTPSEQRRCGVLERTELRAVSDASWNITVSERQLAGEPRRASGASDRCFLKTEVRARSRPELSN